MRDPPPPRRSLDERGEVLAKAYQLSRGNPIEDGMDVLRAVRESVESQGATLAVHGLVTTGYAKDTLKEVFAADGALVETVAHAQSALQLYPDPHVIVDVGGQDIKIVVLRNGRVKDFRLNTQCSAGNGYFLQAIAARFGYPVEAFAESAFSAHEMPVFGHGCVLFLQSEIADVQRRGWRPEEVLAGLAAVLPKNVFLYVAKAPNLGRLGQRFVLQGGTQRNLAAVKAQVDFIRESFRGRDREPDIVLHRHAGEAGAIGAGLEAIRLWREGRRTTFIGLDAAARIAYRARSTEDTRCRYCTNECLRTFIDIWTEGTPDADPPERRLIVATCEKGAAEDVAQMRGIKAATDAVMARTPNLVAVAAREVWKTPAVPLVADPGAGVRWPKNGGRRAARLARARVRIGIPRVFNMYAFAPLFSAYLQGLGVDPDNIVFSAFTSLDMYRDGTGRGAIDPCYPSKVALAHVHDLMRPRPKRRPLDAIFFPMIDVVPMQFVNATGSNACPTVALTPQTVRASFTRDADVFAERGLRYLDPLLDLSDRRLFARQMFDAWAPVLGLEPREHERALGGGFAALAAYDARIGRLARQALDALEREDRLGIVILGRVYHHDPGLNHGIAEDLQKLGYPVFSQSTLPRDPDLLDRLFGDEVRAGVIADPLDISDVWKNSFSASSNLKLWAAKFAARHPNLVAVELSNFKCGHDATIYAAVEEIVESSGTPYFGFKDLDENRPAGAIKLRLETLDYALRRHRDRLVAERQARQHVARVVERYEARLRRTLGAPA
jgi:predicted nucleotide-binding protein (sugar kinase/HSP70/actin superfamily)